MVKQMTDKELRAYINGCHTSRQYGSYFEAACREWNDREDAQQPTTESLLAKVKLQAFPG
jgi:hypothetical protein